jgi:dihydrodipicolinate synthase/N-acetylneuraminate lyase
MAFEGVRPVLHTPFADDVEQPIVHAELAQLARSMLDEGAHGLVALGLASESWAIREAERSEVLAVVAEVCEGRAPFVVGIDGATAVAVDRARRAVRWGAAGLMVLPPRQAAGRDALVRHFATIADAAGVPLLVQDSPQVTGVSLEVPTLAAMAEAHPLVRSVKSEILGAGPKASAIHAEGLELVAGWGGLDYLGQVERGAVGCMPGCDLGPAMVALDRLARSRDAGAAEVLYRRLLPYLSLATTSLELLLLTAKRYLRRRGIFGTETLRSPARGLDPQEARVFDVLLDELAAAGTPGFGPLTDA